MTTVAAALARIGRECSVPAPSAWATATRLEHLELRDDFLLEAVDEIRDRIDLPSPIGKQVTINGTGVAKYNLPSDFRRMARDPLAVYEITTLRRAGTPVHWDGVWTHLGTIGTAGSFRYYKTEGYPGAYTISFEQALSTGRTVTVSYVSNVWVVDSGATEAEVFDDEADVLLLPRRVVELGTIWRFRRRKGLSYADWHGKYEAELARLEMDSRNIRTVHFGDDNDDYKPMRVPVPDVIPSV